ncbi:MAG TPA: aldo/keto reductase [Patescibacteria group bacterium]|nr:aldo/keto reductase [Patescibacteria group bacterium]
MDNLSFQNIKIPALGLGTWQLRSKECIASVAAALGMGYRHVDTAQIYENESEVGEGIKKSGVARGDIFLTTKVWMDRLHDGDLQKSVDESLKRLKTDYVDLLLIHWPVEDVPFAEQLKALQDAQKKGKAKLIGISNFTVAQMKQVTDEIKAIIATNQVEYHPYLSQKPVLDFCRKHGMFLTAYSPVARGAVTKDKTIQEIAKKHGKTPGQVTLRWLIQQGNVAAIPKAASEKHLKENFEIFDFKLADDEMKRIHALAAPDGRLIDPEWAPAWDKAA